MNQPKMQLINRLILVILWKRYGQKLRRIILFQFELITFRFAYEKNRGARFCAPVEPLFVNECYLICHNLQSQICCGHPQQSANKSLGSEQVPPLPRHLLADCCGLLRMPSTNLAL